MAISKEELHRLIDRLSDEQVQLLADVLPSIVIPVDDEPLTPEDMQAIQEAREEFERGESIPLDQLLRDMDDEEMEDRRV